jgi:hypothetical protein
LSFLENEFLKKCISVKKCNVAHNFYNFYSSNCRILAWSCNWQGKGGRAGSSYELDAARSKEVIKEQPTSLNLSATAARVPQCTCPVAASWIYSSAIHTSHHLTPNPHT